MAEVSSDINIKCLRTAHLVYFTSLETQKRALLSRFIIFCCLIHSFYHLFKEMLWRYCAVKLQSLLSGWTLPLVCNEWELRICILDATEDWTCENKWFLLYTQQINLMTILLWAIIREENKSKPCLKSALNIQFSPAGPHWGLETIHVIHTWYIFTPHHDGHKKTRQSRGSMKYSKSSLAPITDSRAGLQKSYRGRAFFCSVLHSDK